MAGYSGTPLIQSIEFVVASHNRLAVWSEATGEFKRVPDEAVHALSPAVAGALRSREIDAA